MNKYIIFTVNFVVIFEKKMSSYKQIKCIAPDFHDKVLEGNKDYIIAKAKELLQSNNDVTILGDLLSMITIIENNCPDKIDKIEDCSSAIVTMMLNKGWSIRKISEYIILPGDKK